MGTITNSEDPDEIPNNAAWPGSNSQSLDLQADSLPTWLRDLVSLQLVDGWMHTCLKQT